ncbi:GtrA family protein [Actinophytocola oryzae]|uniref:GtrA-like protein n=1 Tax=Actinophytocola oryzae TaxID=502181 RepID=A0A4R7VDK3_9PSEU|nr:GtrA family protein [Actinophytocola oryzae]TDV47125.1 GtrA-like protein [Actinophytocola oryzae]
MAPSRIRLARFTVASAIATGLSQVVLVVLYSWTPLDAATASTIAFLAGSGPHFVMVRYWAWPPGKLRAQLTTYLTVTLAGGVASIALTTAAESLVLPLLSPGWQPVALTVSYLAASGPVLVAKFAIFDRVFAARAERGARHAALALAG